MTSATAIHANGIDIHYVELGQGEPLVLLNQGMGSSNPIWAGHPASYAGHVDELAQHFRVIAPDTRGSGQTVHPGGEITYDLLADDIAALIEALGLERPLVCGFSDGGLIATVLALRHPGAARAIVNHGGYDLLNPEAHSTAMARAMLGGRPDATEPDFDAIAATAERVPELSELFALMERDHDAAQGPGHWKTVLAQTFPRITRWSGHSYDELSGVGIPVLLLVGDRDMFCPLEEAVAALRLLPDGELCVLPGTGHSITAAGVQATVEFCSRRS